jgi:hypothetical protein
MAQETSSSDQKTLEAFAEPELTRTGSSSRLNAKAPDVMIPLESIMILNKIAKRKLNWKIILGLRCLLDNKS